MTVLLFVSTRNTHHTEATLQLLAPMSEIFNTGQGGGTSEGDFSNE